MTERMSIWRGFSRETEVAVEVEYLGCGAGWIVCPERGGHEDLKAVAIESNRTIDIDQFVPRDEIDDLYNIRPYYIAPEGKIGADAFVTILEAIAATDKVALGRLVLTTREHVIALEPRGKGLMGTLLRYPYEVRDEKHYLPGDLGGAPRTAP